MRSFNKKNIYGTLLLLVFIASGLTFQSCDEYPNQYEVEDGVPTVDYIRLPDPMVSDSLIAKAFLNTTIAIIGENLTSVTEMWFNDKKAYLNSSVITPNALIVTIPNEIPGTVTDILYLVAGKDTIKYDFHVDVPAPAPRSMVCEFVADGQQAIIKGNYFINDPNVPLQVLFPGELAAEVVSVSKNFDQIVVTVPAGAGAGQLTVKSIYGASRSSFYFKDDRNYILDWDGLDAAGGWRSGMVASADGISGNYVHFKGAMGGDAGATWNEDAFSFNLWNASNGRADVPFYDGDLSKAVLKFECKVTNPWTAGGMQLIFTPYSLNNTNGYIGDGSIPRGLWIPWASSGSFQTDGWITVSIPMADFHFAPDGTEAGSNVTTDMLGGLTFFIWGGGVAGADCDIDMSIDNIRIVPM